MSKFKQIWVNPYESLQVGAYLYRNNKWLGFCLTQFWQKENKTFFNDA